MVFNKWLVVVVVGALSMLVLKVNSQAQMPAPADYGESADYDDKDVQFEPSPPNLLILLADPKNGTTVPLSNQPNTDVVLDRSFEKVHLFCSAYYPIKWTYKGDGFPFLNVDNTRFTEDFYDPTTYAFSALLELEGLKESQTGNYTCQKWDNSTFSSSYYIFVPGDKILLAEKNSTIYIESTSTEVRIPCSVSDPHANVTLTKQFDKGQGEKDWLSISPSLYTYDQKSGFKFTGSAVSTAVGNFQCSVGEHKVFVNVITNNTAAGTREKVEESCCSKQWLRSLGDERTSCRGFISQQCQTHEYLEASQSPCSDWKLAEYFKNPIELCKQEIAPANSSVAVGYFSTNENEGPRLYMYCQADPKEYTQGFKMAVEWSNGSMLFVEDDRLLVPGLSEFPSGYEVHAEITDFLNPHSPLDPLILHCYIPLKYSFKWIKMLKPIPALDLKPFANAWYNSTGNTFGVTSTSSTGTTSTTFTSQTQSVSPRQSSTTIPTTTRPTPRFKFPVEINENVDSDNSVDNSAYASPAAALQVGSQCVSMILMSLTLGFMMRSLFG